MQAPPLELAEPLELPEPVELAEPVDPPVEPEELAQPATTNAAARPRRIELIGRSPMEGRLSGLRPPGGGARRAWYNRGVIDPPDALPGSAFHFKRGLPRDALWVDAQGQGPNGPRWPPRRVLVCGTLLHATQRRLAARGATLRFVPSYFAAIDALAAEPFDVVLVEPAEDDGGLELVKAVKLGQNSFDVAPELLAQAVQRHRLTPMLVLPLANDTEYAVIVLPPEVAILEDTRTVALEDAILRLDVRKLLLSGGPIA